MEQNGAIDQYRMLLLTQVFGIQPGIFSYFNYSLIKNRLIMMTKEKSPFRNLFKYITALPLLLVLGYVMCPTLAYPQDPDNPTGKNVKSEVSPLPAIPPPPPPPPPPPTPEQLEKFKAQERANATEGHAYIYVDQQAQFQGGTLEDFTKWIQANLIYPPIAKENGIIGKVVVQFAVNTAGKVFDVKIIRGVDPSLDQEVLRVIQTSPEWTPAENKGMKVAQQFVIPVIFSLEKKPGVTGESSYKYEKYDASIVTEKAAQQIQDNQQGEPAFVFVEQQASFQGGYLETFREWVQKNLVYPAIAKEDGIFGRVTTQFAVNSQGKICDVKVLRGVDPSLDQEAVRVITSSPDWAPAKQGGRNVKQQFVMPVVFTFENKGILDINVSQLPAVIIPTPTPKTQAKFQGGDIFLFHKWVQQHLIYPPEAKKNNITGDVMVRFTVTSAGKVSDVTASKSTSPLLETEAVRVIESSPAWEPAQKDGKNVDQTFLLNVSFAL
jgi:TonB family protein